MRGTFASRAFLISAAIFGSDATQDARGVHTALVMSRTRSAAPLTGTSTATAAGTLGIGEVGVGATVAATVGAVVGEAEGAAACGAHAAIASRTGSARPSLFINGPAGAGGGAPEILESCYRRDFRRRPRGRGL